MSKKSTHQVVPLPSLSELHGKPLDPARNTHPWSLAIQRDIAERVIKLADQWIRRVRAEFKEAPGQTIRKHLEEGKSSVTLGAAVPPELAAEVMRLAELSERKRNFVAAWAIRAGASRLTAENLAEALPGVRPSISLVAVVALKLGLAEYSEHFKLGQPQDQPKTQGESKAKKQPSRARLIKK